MEQKRIAAIVGSLRENSYNRQLALAAKEIVGDRAIFEIVDYDDVPMMNQDIEYPAPDAVCRVREQIKSADGVWIFTPEYNHSYPGVLKNLIDWLSRPISKEERQVLSRKAIAVSGASPGMGGTVTAQDLLVMTAALDKPERQIEKLLPLLQANARAGFLQSAGKFSDWLLAALLCHRAGESAQGLPWSRGWMYR